MKLNKPSFLSLLTFFLIIVAIIFFLWRDYSIFPSVPTNKNNSEAQLKHPVSVDNPDVLGLYLSYNFAGIVKEVKDENNMFSIILDTNQPTTPKFNISQETQIFKVSAVGNTPTPAKLEDIANRARVSIAATYDLKTGEWITRTVHLIP